jgi:tol-pal system-associated acyl-CoA thioesterase
LTAAANARGFGVTKYVLPIRVYLEDTDAQGVVYNASYFRFMERARTEWLRERGVDHEQWLGEHGVVLVLASIEARFRAPARLSDVLYVSAALLEARGARIRFAQEVRCNSPNGELVCEGVAEVACKDASGGKPRRLPPGLMSEWSA